MKRLIFILAIVLLAQCTSSQEGGKGVSNQSAISMYYSTMTELTVSVVYESGATPFTGNINSGSMAGTPYWSLLKNNLAALFEGRSQAVTFHVPTTTAEMTAIGAQNKTSWTTDEIKALAEQYKTPDTNTHAHFIILFLKGNFSEDGSTNSAVVGVNLTGYPILAIFKDVVTSTGSSSSGPVPKFVEQSTLVHEMGHALGLVNNGVPMASEHQDSSHGAHCNNPNCVMYYLNEGKSDLVLFAQQLIASGSTIMFKDDCLNDTKNYKP